MKICFFLSSAKRMLIVITLSVLVPSISAANDLKESRVILDETFDWLTPAQADRTLKRIKAAGFNVFIPCVWHGRGTSWPSSLAPREPLWEKVYNNGYDPLKELIKKAHAMGIEVHPWFTVSLRQREFLPQYYDSGTPDKAFNIHLPEFRKYINDLMMEVVKKYDIDGINIDYIRSKGVCLSDICSDMYKKQTGYDVKHDYDKRNKLGIEWQRLGNWNASAVDNIVQTLSKDIRDIKPDIIISVDSKAGAKHLLYHGTNSIKWANNGWIDVIYHMDYRQEPKWDEMKSAQQSMKNPNKFVHLVGNFEYLNKKRTKVKPRDANLVSDLISQSRNIAIQKNIVALYELPYLSQSQIDVLRKGPFKLNAMPDWSIQKLQ